MPADISSEKLDAIDLFYRQRRLLGIITEVEFKLLVKPEGFLSGIVFFKNEKELLNFVKEARDVSFATRKHIS